jgi:hypothetical protein
MPVPSTLVASLQAAGLDPAHLPALEDVPDDQVDAVMKTFTKALGVKCKDCHQTPDFAKETTNKRIARKMWDQLVRGMTMADGSPLYCDSCHQGKATFLDRSDTGKGGALSTWMKAAYVGGLKQADGSANTCSSCHGKPFKGSFLDDWGADPDADGGVAPTDGGAPGPDGGSVDAGSTDAGPSDGGVVAMDAAPDAGQPSLGCGALVDCINNCADDACTNQCVQAASAAALTALNGAVDCALGACESRGRCVDDSDTSDGCNACFNNALSGGQTGLACVPKSDSACGVCAAQWTACVDN